MHTVLKHPDFKARRGMKQWKNYVYDDQKVLVEITKEEAKISLGKQRTRLSNFCESQDYMEKHVKI